jgi:hypothetical protein
MTVRVDYRVIAIRQPAEWQSTVMIALCQIENLVRIRNDVSNGYHRDPVYS